jgi:hypothetical protein
LTRLQRFRVIVVVVVVVEGSSAGRAAADIITFSSRTRRTGCVFAPPAELALELATLPKSIIAMGAAAASFSFTFSLSAPLIAESLLLSPPTLLLILLLLAPAHR